MKIYLSAPARAGFAAAALILLTGAAAPTLAPLADFTACDGYALPSRGSDGVTSVRVLLGMNNMPGYANPDRAMAALSDDGGSAAIASCDAALASLPPAFWMRRMTLLRARAQHRLEVRDLSGALADIDLSDAVGATNDPLLHRSLGVANHLLRAFVLREAARDAEADSAIKAALALRPFDLHTLKAAHAALGPGAAPDLARTVDFRLAALAPWSDAIVLSSGGAEGAYVSPFDENRKGTLIGNLPEAEPRRVITPWKDATKVFAMKGSYYAFMSEGYSVEQRPDGIAIVGGRGIMTTSYVVEEIALLRAAELALEAGKTGLIVLDRRDIPCTVMNQDQWGTPLGEVPAGFRTQLAVVLVDIDDLPADYADQAARVLDAKAIHDALAPVFIPAPTKPRG